MGVRGPKTAKPIGKPLQYDDLDKFEGQQIYQLYELKQAIDGEPGDANKQKSPKGDT